MKRVILHVDRLVLRGVRHEDRYEIGEALREELGRQFGSEDAVRGLVSAGDLSRPKVGEVSVGLGSKPSRVGVLAARGISREVKS